MRISRFQMVTAVLALVATALLAALAGSTASINDIGRMTTGRTDDSLAAPLVSPFSVASQPGPCDHLEYGRMITGAPYELFDSTVEEWVNTSDVVAKVVITETRTPRFDTPDGLPPPPLSYTDPTPTYEEEDAYGDRLYTPVVVDATRIYSGTQITGYVLFRAGGTSPVCPEYVYKEDPAVLEGDVGNEGMLMLFDPGDDLLQDPPDWFQHLLDIADELSLSPGAQYEVKLVNNWYRYVGSDAISPYAATGISIQQLEDEVEAATGP